MTTFASPTPLTERITNAKATLEQARREGHQPIIDAAQRVLDGLLARIACRPLALIDPELDKRLRVDMQ